MTAAQSRREITLEAWRWTREWLIANPNASLWAIAKRVRYYKRREREGWTMPVPSLADRTSFFADIRAEFRFGPKTRVCPMTGEQVGRAREFGAKWHVGGGRLITPFGDLKVR